MLGEGAINFLPLTAERLPTGWLSDNICVTITEDPPCRDG